MKATLTFLLVIASSVKIAPWGPGVEITSQRHTERGWEATLSYPKHEPSPLEALDPTWAELVAKSDPDTARRLLGDPGLHPGAAGFTVLVGDGGRGFTVPADTLAREGAMTIPAFGAFLTTGESREAHDAKLAPLRGSRVLDRAHNEPEATYEAMTSIWEDMGKPTYRNPAGGPGHVATLGWDGVSPKIGIDPMGDARSDDGSPAPFSLRHGLDGWIAQRLENGLPVVTTVLEKDQLRFEIEALGHAVERDNLALLEKITVRSLSERPRRVMLPLTYERQGRGALHQSGNAFVETGTKLVALTIDGGEMRWAASQDTRAKRRSLHLFVFLDLPANGAAEVIVRLAASPARREALEALDYAKARADVLAHWSAILARGARFEVPEKTVNDLFRASLVQARMLPRREKGKLHLPYSSFAYFQTGIPWPSLQGMYVDYMLYDLRGYHDLSAAELAASFARNQRPDGRIAGYANWAVNTPALLFAVGKSYLLSRDAAAFRKVLPRALRAMSWCLAQLHAGGLATGPLNDGTGKGVWALTQGYFHAGLSAFASALEDIGHPRAAQARAAARAVHAAVEKQFALASARSPVVPLRDGTWSPYVPSAATASGRRFDQWYPTDVDTGAVHLVRLRALDPNGPLADALLDDHEDNLYLSGLGAANEPVYAPQGMAYLLRDDAKAAIRTFYTTMASAFSHTVFAPVEHRWGRPQFFGPPSTSGAWFELYRGLLVHEVDDTLVLGRAIPRAWLEDGKAIVVENAPTEFGKLSLRIASHEKEGHIDAKLSLSGPHLPRTLFVRLRHPLAKPPTAARYDGAPSSALDATKEWVRIDAPVAGEHEIVVSY